MLNLLVLLGLSDQISNITKDTDCINNLEYKIEEIASDLYNVKRDVSSIDSEVFEILQKIKYG